MNIPRRIFALYLDIKNKKAFYPLLRFWLLNGASRPETEGALEELWRDTDPVSRDTGRAWKKVSSAVFPRNSKKIIVRKIAWAAAACLFIPLLSVIVVRLVSDSRNTGPLLTEISVPYGQTSSFVLPDSSSVILNSGSVIEFPEEFSDSARIVRLDGEAVFSVKKDPARPFIVKSASVETKVLGTVFNMKSYSEDGYSSVSVAEGKVSVRAADGPASGENILGISDRIVIDRKTGEFFKTEIRPEEVYAWADGIIDFRGAGIDEVAKTLERTFGVSIVYTDDRKFSQAKITAKFSKSQTLPEILDVLKLLIPGMEYRISGNEVYLS